MPAENLVGEVNEGWDYRQVPARQRARRRRAGRLDQARSRAGVPRRPARGPARRRPAGRGADRRAREPAARARADRAARRRQLLRRQAAPGLVGAQAQGHRAAAGSQRAVARPCRAALAGQPAPATELGVAELGARRHARLPEPPQGLHLRRLQRGATPDHRPHDPGSRGARHGLPTTTSRTPSARRSAACSARPTATTRTAAGVEKDPGFDEELWARMAEMGSSGCRSPRRTAAWAPARSRSASCARSSAGSSRPSRTSPPSCWPAAWSPPAAPAEQRQEILGALSAGELVLAFAHAEPGRPLGPGAESVSASGRRLVDADRRQGAGAARRTRRRARGQRRAARTDGTGLFLVDAAMTRHSTAPVTRPTTAAGPRRWSSTTPPRRRSASRAPTCPPASRPSRTSPAYGGQPGARRDASCCRPRRTTSAAASSSASR